jgi:hypothetical protein
LNHPNPGAKLLELDPPKGLGEKVGELVLGVDVAGLDAPLKIKMNLSFGRWC